MEVQEMVTEWTAVGSVEDFTENMGGCVKLNGKQIAIFNLKNKTEWYAIQNLCPHDQRMVLSRGLIGDKGSEPKVACPLHKHNFSLKTGKHLSEGNIADVATFPVKVEDGKVFLQI